MQTTNHSEREHSKISPSKLAKLEICAGYLDDPDREVHAITLQGTKCHQAAETGEIAGLTDEELAWVKMCRDYTVSLGYGTWEAVYDEIKLPIIDGMWGFADKIILATPTMAHLVDYKFGNNSQEDVETNPAAQAYVLGMFQRWPELETIHVHYLYPRREEISRHTYTRKDVPTIRLRIETIVARVEEAAQYLHSNKPGALTPVPENCLYCARKATCQALHRSVLPLATRYANNHAIDLQEPDFSKVTRPEQWTTLLAYAPVLEQMADSIKRHALEFREQSGVEIPGYEMRSRQGKKKINNAQMAYEVAMAAGVDHDAFMRCVDVSAKQLTDAAGEKAAKGKKASVVRELEGRLRDAGVLESGGESFFLGRVRT